LKLENIPRADSDWRQSIAPFASTFCDWDGVRGSLQELWLESRHRYRKQGVVPGELTELRACLFFEQWHWRWCGYKGEKGSPYLPFVHALVGAIRDKVEK